MRFRSLVLVALWAALARGDEIDDLLARTLQSAREWPAVLDAVAARGPAAVAPLVDRFASADPKVAKAAYKCLLHLAGRRPEEPVAAALVAQLDRDLPDPVKMRLLELIGLVASDSAVPTLVRFLAHPALRDPARTALAQIPGPVSAKALCEAAGAADGDWKLALLSAIGTQGGPGSAAFLAAQLGGDAATQTIALRGLGRVGGPEDLKAIQALWASPDRVVRRAAIDAALQLAPRLARPETVYLDLIAAMPEEHHLCAAIRGLGAAGGTANLSAIFYGLTSDSSPVRETARQVLGEMSGEGVTNAIRREYAGAGPSARTALLAALAQREGAGAVADFLAALDDGDATVRSTGARLLGELADLSVAERLVALASTDPEDATRRAAVRAYLRLAEREVAGGRTKPALAMMHQALELAADAAEKRIALNDIAGIGDPESLPLVQPFLEVAELRRPAAEAVMGIAGTLVRRGDTAAATGLCERIIALGYRDLGNLAAQRLRSFGIRRDFAGEAGFVTGWWVIGPFPNENKVANSTAYFPEQGVNLVDGGDFDGRHYGWRQHRVEDVYGVTDLRQLFDPHDNVAAYAYAEIIAPEARDVLLKMGSDDGLFCWLNGEQIHANPVDRGISIDSDVVKARLAQGINRILLKITQGGGNWDYCLRITDPDGAPLVFAQPPPPFTDWVTRWAVIGPFPNDNNTGRDTVYPPEEKLDFGAEYDGAVGKVKWQVAEARAGVLDLKGPCRARPENAVAYCYTIVHSAADLDCTLRLGSDDGVKVWLNGALVHHNPTARPCTPDQDLVPVRLKAGANDLLVKVDQGMGGWELAVRFGRAEGGMEGVTFALPEGLGR